MNTKERIHEVMNSLDGMERAEAHPFLYAKILNKINTVREERSPAKWAWLTAASFIVLLMLNFRAMQVSTARSEKAEAQEIAQGYQLMNTTNFNYNQ